MAMLKKPICNCGCSTGIHESDNATGKPDAPWGLTFGWGKLDENGYWEKPCSKCARWAEQKDGVPINSYWPFEENQPIIIDFSHTMTDVRPRKLWQQLFNFYREKDCPLDHMDNMLIDLQYCTEAFNKVRDRGRIKFLWGCTPKFFPTEWMWEKRWEDMGINLCILSSSHEWFVLCNLTKDRAVFTPQYPEDL